MCYISQNLGLRDMREKSVPQSFLENYLGFVVEYLDTTKSQTKFSQYGAPTDSVTTKQVNEILCIFFL